MSAVEFRQVRKRYDDKEVIRGIDLQIRRGEFAVIVGPLGSGKSTLLRMVAGLETLSAGEILLGDTVVNRLPPEKRDIAMVFQHDALYSQMTVFQNMAYGLRLRGFSREEINYRVNKTAQRLQLESWLKYKPLALSSEQRQRVSIARAMVREPTLFLFDEPLTQLDPAVRLQMRMEIYQLQRHLGATSIYVTCDQTEAMVLADRLIVMNEGRVEQVGRPLDVYRRPDSMFVAGFLGSPGINFLEVDVCDGGRALSLDHHLLPLPFPALRQYEGRSVILGIRPEALQIAQSEDQDLIRMRVDAVEALGSETIIYGKIVDSAQQLVVKLLYTIRTHPGELMTLSIGPEQMNFFDKHTGKRILGA